MIKQDENEIIINAVSVINDEVVDEDSISTKPQSPTAAARNVLLHLEDGTITLRPLTLGRTRFTFMALLTPTSVDGRQISEIKLSTSEYSSSLIRGKRSGFKISRLLSEGTKDAKLFRYIATLFYEHFKQEDVIDERRKVDFIENKIPNAPPLTEGEQEMIEESMKFVEDVTSRAKRVAGTVNESVEKFYTTQRVVGPLWG